MEHQPSQSAQKVGDRRLLAILNPTSGKGAGVRVIESVLPTFEAGGIRCQVLETRRAHHAEEIARDIDLEGVDALLAVGGDGTVHDILNGMLARADGRKLPIGVIPAGAGNALAFDLDCLDPKRAAERIVRFERRVIDLAEVRVGDRVRYAFNIVGWGLAADINRFADRMRVLGKHRYTFAALVEILRLGRPVAKVSVEGEESRGVLVFAMGCLTRYTGAGMKIAPEAVLDDGLIDLLLVRDPSKWEILKIFPKVFRGDHMGHPEFEYRQVKEFSLFSDTPGVLNLDGETLSGRNCSVRVLPRHIEILN